MPEKRPRNYYDGQRTKRHGRTVLMRGTERLQGQAPTDCPQDAQDAPQPPPKGNRAPIDPRTFDAHLHCATVMERLAIGTCAGRRCRVCGRVFQLARGHWFEVT
jgi:hypothetical protein